MPITTCPVTLKEANPLRCSRSASRIAARSGSLRGSVSWRLVPARWVVPPPQFRTQKVHHLLLSKSCLQAMLQHQPTNSIIREIQKNHTDLKKARKEVIFCWLPSHIGITENEKADQAAKRALEQRSDKRKRAGLTRPEQVKMARLKIGHTRHMSIA